MVLRFQEESRTLRRGRATLVYCTRLVQAEGGSPAIEACYAKAAKAMEAWAMNTWLLQEEKRLSEAPRRSRLHYVQPKLSFYCEGSVIAQRWVSVSLTVLLQQSDGIRRQCDYRVWDGVAGRLCPLEFFLSRKAAKRYPRWSFLLNEDAVWVVDKKERDNLSLKNLVSAGKF